MDVVQKHLRQQALQAGLLRGEPAPLTLPDRGEAATVRHGAADPDQASLGVLDVDLVSPLRDALYGHPSHGRLELQHLPHVDLRDGTVLGMEALVRWSDPDRGTIWPADILPVARAADLMPRLGRWVLDAVVAQAAIWALSVPVATRHWFNVEGSQLAEWGFTDALADRARHAGLQPSVFGVHVHDDDLLAPDARTRAALDALRAAGVAIGVDGVGGNPDILARLAWLPVDAVTLTTGLVRNPAHDLLVASIVSLAEHRGIAVVAAGVQTRAEADRMLALGVGVGFGYLFTGPQRADRAAWTLAHSGGGAWRGSFVGEGQQSPQAVSETYVGPDLHDVLPPPHL